MIGDVRRWSKFDIPCRNLMKFTAYSKIIIMILLVFVNKQFFQQNSSVLRQQKSHSVILPQNGFSLKQSTTFDLSAKRKLLQLMSSSHLTLPFDDSLFEDDIGV